MTFIKPYRVVAKIKNNKLWRAILDTWPDTRNQNDAARKLGIGPSELGNWLNMREWPGDPIKLEEGVQWWTDRTEQICLAIGASPEVIFDPALYGLQRLQPKTVELEMAMPEIEERGLLMIEGPQSFEMTEEQVSAILRMLTPREEQVIRMRLGIGCEPMTIEEIAKKFCISKGRTYQVILRAMRKLGKMGPRALSMGLEP